MKIRKAIKAKEGFVVGAIFLVCMFCFGSFMWDRSENEYDRKQLSYLIYGSIRDYHEWGDPDAIMFPLVGSVKTKIYHRFTSDCALDIGHLDFVGFNTKDQANKQGYRPCDGWLCLHR